MAFAQAVTHLAVVTLFLILSSCRCLHVIEYGHELQETLIFGTHHKTGTSLAEKASKCFDSSFNYTLDPHWSGGPLGPNEKVLHFTRNLISLALSAYTYHRETGEVWSLEAGSAWVLLGEDPFLREYLIYGNESYTGFLHRVRAEVGIRAEIYRLSLRSGELEEIKDADQFCAGTSRCKQICLEDFTVSSSSYDTTWRNVVRFMEKRVTRQMHQCLSMEDLNRNPEDNGHVISSSMAEDRYNRLWNMVVELDAAYFNSTLKNMSVGRLDCGTSNFLSGAGSKTPAGVKYSRWLIEELYA